MSVQNVLRLELDRKPEIKLVFFDVDGTLLDKKGHYSKKLQYELARVQSLGVKTAIASGRPAFACRFLIEELGLLDPGVFLTGAHIFDPQRQLSLHEEPIIERDNLALREQLKNNGLYAELYTSVGYYIEPSHQCDVQVEHARQLRVSPEVQNFDSIIASKPVLKWLLGAKDHEQAKTLKDLESAFPGLEFAYAHFPLYPEWTFANVIDRRASKSDAFSRLLRYHGLEANNVMSFGDSHSDMTFLRLAGWGIAMGNADSAVKRAARAVTLSADEDGVALALEKMI